MQSQMNVFLKLLTGLYLLPLLFFTCVDSQAVQKQMYSYSCCIILLQCRCQGLVENLIVAKSNIILVYMSRTASD